MNLSNTIRNYPFIRARQDLKKLPPLENPFFIIATTGTLHIVELCRKHIPENVQVILILNGLKRWETQYIRNNIDVDGILTANNMGGRMIPHGRIMDFLFRNIAVPFGIIDADCFVFTLKCLKKSQLSRIMLLSMLFFKTQKGSLPFLKLSCSSSTHQ